MTERKIVLKMGGSLLFDENLALRLDSFSTIVNVVKKSQHVAAVVIGGGKIARKFIQAAREFQANESRCDTFGIQASRLNALLLITALDSRAYPVVIESPRSFNLNAVTASISQRIMVAGGFIPGQSTTSVTFQIAEMLE
ncbi:MAG: UMP kinase, partial [Promethearchaeia archaeon]